MKKDRRRQKITLVDIIKNDTSIKGVTKNITLDRVEWRQKIYMTNPK